jgi:NitT/TauT family transport system ATP-binding protein
VREKIIVRELSKSFEGRRSNTLALDCVNLTLMDGEFVCIVGPSGCGKTTILRIIAGLEEPSSGTITVNRSAAGERPLNAMVFQEQSLLPWLTVIDNVAFGLEMRGIGRRERYDRAQPYLEMVGLTRFRDHYPRQLSGGMKQRVSLARAFAGDPEILLMDEPFASLDAQNKLILQEELLRIWEDHRKTVIFITHAIDEALTLGDRVAVMSAGPGRIKEVIDVGFERPRHVAELHAQPQFGELSLKIWRMLESEVRKSRESDAA